MVSLWGEVANVGALTLSRCSRQGLDTGTRVTVRGGDPMGGTHARPLFQARRGLDTGTRVT
eukprot:1179462-Prorocentrum_minimum.AAC.3